MLPAAATALQLAADGRIIARGSLCARSRTRDGAVAASLASDTQPPAALGGGQVVEVEADGFGDAGASEAHDRGERPVAWGGGLGGALPADVVAADEGLRCAAGGQVEPGDGGAVELAEAAAQRQVGCRGERGVDGGRSALERGVQVGLVVAGGPRGGGRVGEWVAVEVGVGEPG